MTKVRMDVATSNKNNVYSVATVPVEVHNPLLLCSLTATESAAFNDGTTILMTLCLNPEKQ